MEMKYFTAQTYEELKDEMRDLLNTYEYEEGCPYDPSDFGLDKIITTWYSAKEPLLAWMSRHPNYNGKGQIVLTEEYDRKVDHGTIYTFLGAMASECAELLNNIEVPEKVTLVEPEDRSVSVFVKNMLDYVGKTTEITYRCDDTYRVAADGGIWWWDAACFAETAELTNRIAKAKRFFEYFSYTNDWHMQYADENLTNKFNEAFPWLRAHVGAKVTKLFRRIFKEYKLDQMEEFNAKWPGFADALNPLKVTRFTIISANPIDYYTMSFGNDWQSCHTIDKTQRRHHAGQDYQGCYSSGTESYMLDGTTLVVYIVDKSYDGNEFELQPKLSRQMFHIGEEKIIQGRLYPQDNDSGATETYRQIRQIVQRVYAECNDVPNMWKVEKGTEECNSVIVSFGTHYRDYHCFDNCNVSYLKTGEENGLNITKIIVGRSPICPRCGCEHGVEENILCDDCVGSRVYCERCGREVDPDDYDTIHIGDNYYCDRGCAEEDGWVYCNNIDEWCSKYDCDVFYNDYRDEWCYDNYCEKIVTEDGFRCFEDEMEEAGVYWDEEDECYRRREDA